jgi:hypothetical protein
VVGHGWCPLDGSWMVLDVLNLVHSLYAVVSRRQ